MSRNLPLIPVVLLAITLVAIIAGCSSPNEPPATDANQSLPTALPAIEELVETVTTEPEPAGAEATVHATALDAPANTPLPTQTPRPTYTPRPKPASPGEGERRPGPRFEAALLNGSLFDFAETLGTPTLLVFWAPW